jgi:hypothetical protein
MNNTIEFLKRLRDQGFYGKVEIAFQAGDVVTIRQEACFKPNSLPLGVTRNDLNK